MRKQSRAEVLHGLFTGFSALKQHLFQSRNEHNKEMAKRHDATMEHLNHRLKAQNAYAKARMVVLHLISLYQSRELRMIGAAFRHWHSTTFREHMQQTVTQLRSEASRALHRAHEATAEQVAARRAGMLRGLITRQLRFKMSKGFEGLRQAAWAGQNQVHSLIVFVYLYQRFLCMLMLRCYHFH